MYLPMFGYSLELEKKVIAANNLISLNMNVFMSN